LYINPEIITDKDGIASITIRGGLDYDVADVDEASTTPVRWAAAPPASKCSRISFVDLDLPVH